MTVRGAPESAALRLDARRTLELAAIVHGAALPDPSPRQPEILMTTTGAEAVVRVRTSTVLR